MPEQFRGRVRIPSRTRPRIQRPDRLATIRAVAGKPDVSTRRIELPDATAAIFVDHSGRRGRRLRRVAYGAVLLVLVLLALFWLSQGADLLGLAVPG
jgi:hypothetical protein